MTAAAMNLAMMAAMVFTTVMILCDG
jgi:hypothetical protein